MVGWVSCPSNTIRDGPMSFVPSGDMGATNTTLLSPAREPAAAWLR